MCTWNVYENGSVVQYKSSINKIRCSQNGLTYPDWGYEGE